VDDEAWLSNCLNRSMSVCCAGGTTVNGDGDRTILTSCCFHLPGKCLIVRAGLSSEPAMLFGLPIRRDGSQRVGCLSEKFQVGNALILVLTGGFDPAFRCSVPALLNSLAGRPRHVPGLHDLFRRVAPRISAGVSSIQFLRRSSSSCIRNASAVKPPARPSATDVSTDGR